MTEAMSRVKFSSYVFSSVLLSPFKNETTEINIITEALLRLLITYQMFWCVVSLNIFTSGAVF